VSSNDLQDIRETSQIAWILQHRLKSGFLFHASTDFHPTVASAQHHDDVISGAAWLEIFTDAILGDFIAYELIAESFTVAILSSSVICLEGTKFARTLKLTRFLCLKH